MTTDTNKNASFWRWQPHLFIPAHWGPEYCRCCLDGEDGAIHNVETDRGTHPGNLTGYRVARASEVIYAVVGWNDDGGGCSYGGKRSWEEAIEFLETVKDDYEHFQIDERIYYTAVDTNVAVIC